MPTIPVLWLFLSILVLVRKSSCFSVVIHTKTCYVKPFALSMFPWLSSLLRPHPPQPCTSLLLTLRVLRLHRFDYYYKADSRVPLQRLFTVPAAYMPNDCLDSSSGLFYAFPLPLICAVIVVIFVNFRHFVAVYFRSAPVNLPERLLSSLTPCPLNTSRVDGKHRRVV